MFIIVISYILVRTIIRMYKLFCKITEKKNNTVIYLKYTMFKLSYGLYL